MLEQSPRHAVAVELSTIGVDVQLRFVAEASRDFPSACAIVVADRALAGYRWLACELGATAFAVSTRELEPIAALTKRHVAAAAPVELNVMERIWEQLPWSSSESMAGN